MAIFDVHVVNTAGGSDTAGVFGEWSTAADAAVVSEVFTVKMVRMYHDQ